MIMLSKIQLSTDEFIRQVAADRELAALNRFITFPTSSSEALCDIQYFTDYKQHLVFCLFGSVPWFNCVSIDF